MAAFVFAALVFFKFYPVARIGETEQTSVTNDTGRVDVINREIIFSIDKTKYYPLETAIVKIEPDKEMLPITLRIAKSDDPDDNFMSRQINSDISEIPVTVGGELGDYKVYFEKNGRAVSSELHYQLNTGNYISTGDSQLDGLFPQVKKWMLSDISSCGFVSGYRSPDTDRIWLRDHTYQMKAFKYWESNVTDMVDYFLDQQSDNGSLPDFICPNFRMGVEADVEYLSVLAAYGAWQSTGDDEWMFSILPKLEKALLYSTTDPYRWDDGHKLVKRPFTIDFWDFQWGDGSDQINNNTKFGILASDNSGVYQAAKILSKLFRMQGNDTKAAYWEKTAQGIKENSDKYLWDPERGYYRSFLHLEDPVPPVEMDESEILSLGNVYNINRDDFSSSEQAKSIIKEYQSRAGATWNGKQVFEEWFSINPDYGADRFNTNTDAEKSGGYVNGSIMPLVGGELSAGALRNGFEEYGIKNIRDYIKMTADAGNKTYLWYWPDGKPGAGSQTLSTDGWGSSAFLSAFVEELIGVKDLNRKFDQLYFSPKWPAAGINSAKAAIRYGASDGYVAYEENINKADGKINIILSGALSEVTAHILLPKNASAVSVTVNEIEAGFNNSKIEKSNYVDFTFENHNVTAIEIGYKIEKSE